MPIMAAASTAFSLLMAFLAADNSPAQDILSRSSAKVYTPCELVRSRTNKSAINNPQQPILVRGLIITASHRSQMSMSAKRCPNTYVKLNIQATKAFGQFVDAFDEANSGRYPRGLYMTCDCYGVLNTDKQLNLVVSDARFKFTVVK